MKGTTRSIRKDYLQADTPLRGFFEHSPLNPDFEAIIREKSKTTISREVLSDIIRGQYSHLELYPATEEALKKLASPTSFTVTTGHQLVFLGGPLFTTYKVLHTIKLAQTLSQKFPNYQIVPIFWIHTEDHDFEEINHYYPSYREMVEYSGSFSGKVGQHLIEPEISELLPLHFSSELREAYEAGKSWTDAYRSFMHQLFGPLGVLMIDADDPRLKSQFRKVFRRDIQENFSQACVNTTSDQLREKGYIPQVHPREINIFYLKGPLRNRIVKEGGRYRANQTEIYWTEKELLELLDQHPEYFSPNVCLRPLYQEQILPNLAYIGGWGELSYWMQLKGLFQEVNTPFPLLMPRMSATLFRAEEAQKWKDFGLSLQEIESPIPQLNKKLLQKYWKADSLKTHFESIHTELSRLESYIQTFSQTLPRSVEGHKVKSQRFFQRLEKKLEKSIMQGHPEFRELAALKEIIQPDRVRQERVLSLASFPNYSPQDLIKQIFESCQPLNYSPRIVTLEKMVQG